VIAECSNGLLQPIKSDKVPIECMDHSENIVDVCHIQLLRIDTCFCTHTFILTIHKCALDEGIIILSIFATVL